MTTSVVCEILHFQETNLVESSGENVDYMPVVSSSFGKAVVELTLLVAGNWEINSDIAHLNRLLVVFDIVPVDVMVGSHRLLQFRPNNMARTFGGRSTGEDHDTSTGVLERSLQETNSNAQSNASTSQRSSVISNRPWVMLKLLEDVCDLEFRLLDG